MNPLKISLIHSWDGDDRNHYFISPPLGVHRIAKWARSKLGSFVDIEVIDPNLFNPSDALDMVGHRLWLRQPDVIGFSPLHLTLENDIAMMLTSAEVCPDAFFLAGGRQATSDPSTLFSEFSHLHTIVKGEAELIFCEILQVIRKHGVYQVNNNPAYLSDICGLFLKGKNKVARDTGINPGLTSQIFREATWLMDFSEMDLEQYWTTLKAQYSHKQLDKEMLRKIHTIKPITTNFCPMNCSFCDVTSKQRRDIGSSLHVTGLRGQDLEGYVTMLLEKHPEVQQVLFKDDLWFLRGKGAIRGTKSSPLLYNDLAALKRVKQRFVDRNITFSGKARVDTFVDPTTLEVDWPLLNATRQAGFVSISMGVESFDYNDLIYFNKRLGINGPNVNKLAIQSVVKADISSVSYLILVNDKSTTTSIFTNAAAIVDLLEESNKHVLKLNDFLFPLPGTALTEIFGQSESQVMTEKKRFSIPGFANRYIERVVKIYPTDPTAHKLMTEYEEGKFKTQSDTKSELDIRHWISEYSTPAYIRLLYETANKLKLIDKNYFEQQHYRLTQILNKLSTHNIDHVSATLTDA